MRHRVNMRRCIACDNPMSLNTQMERVAAECRSSTCANQPYCIHGWLEIQNQSLCPVCKSVVGGNVSIPIFESANNTADNRNNVPLAEQRTEASDTYTDFLFSLKLHWIFLTIVIIILAASSCVMFFMI